MCLRWVENPRDTIAAFRVFQLFPASARPRRERNTDASVRSRLGLCFSAEFVTPAAAAAHWPELCGLLSGLRKTATALGGTGCLARQWYQPHLERLYDHVTARSAI